MAATGASILARRFPRTATGSIHCSFTGPTLVLGVTSFEQVVLVSGVGHIADCESPLFNSRVQQELQLRWLGQLISQRGARAPSHPKGVVAAGTINSMQEVLAKTS